MLIPLCRLKQVCVYGFEEPVRPSIGPSVEELLATLAEIESLGIYFMVLRAPPPDARCVFKCLGHTSLKPCAK